MALTQMKWAQNILQALADQGVEEILLCPGARNAPFVTALSNCSGFKVSSFFEERSAGFFALGRMKVSSRPVVVCTTSGTAVAELLPATIEADYQSLPLIILSADRPQNYRGTGAPQTIVQPGIFSHYVEKTWDLLEPHADFNLAISNRPIHINVCFDEPLIDETLAAWAVQPSSAQHKISTTSFQIPRAPGVTPLVLAGGLSSAQADKIAPILQSWQRPVYVEALSHLRGHPDLKGLEILSGDLSLSHIEMDSVIRVGDVPTLRFWRDLEKSSWPVLHFTDAPFPGLAREQTMAPLATLRDFKNQFQAWSSAERDRDQEISKKIHGLLHEFSSSEQGLVHHLSGMIPPSSRIFLGNSLPIREWDFAAVRKPRFELFGNRGVNGIDGLISTFLGLSEPGQNTVALIGDLSALYDLSAPWAARNWPDRDLTLIIINNGGGKIFEKIFNNPLFENRHHIDFSAWAKMWGWSYQKLSRADEAWPDCKGPNVIEIVPDPEQTKDLQSALEKLRC